MNIAHAASEGGISIHLSAPVLGHFFGIPLTSTLVMVWFTMIILAVFAILMRPRLKLVPGKTQVVVETLIGGAFDYMAQALESRELAKKFFPLIMSIFIFILALNWLGLVPGVNSIGIYTESHGEEVRGTSARLVEDLSESNEGEIPMSGQHQYDEHALVPFLYPANTDLNITIGLAIIAFFAIEIAGIAFLGLFKYGGKFINFSSPLNFLIGIIELFSELARLVSFSFRLFGNIFAGKTLIVIAIFFVPFILPVPLLAFELFVGFIQAFIFAVLTLFFIKLAIAEPEHH